MSRGIQHDTQLTETEWNRDENGTERKRDGSTANAKLKEMVPSPSGAQGTILYT